MIIILKGNPISSQNAYWQHGKIRYMKKRAKAKKLKAYKIGKEFRVEKENFDLFLNDSVIK